MKSSALLKLLKENGWEEVRVKSSHHQLKHPDFQQVLTVPHPKKDLPKGLVEKILKTARLK